MIFKLLMEVEVGGNVQIYMGQIFESLQFRRLDVRF